MTANSEKNEKDSKSKVGSHPEEEKSEQSKEPLNIDPEEARFIHSGGKSEHMIVNFTSHKMAIKARCGSSYYKIDPTHLIVEANKCKQMVITRTPGPIGTDKVIVQYMECDSNATDPKAVFKAAGDAKIPSLKIKLIASASGGRKMSKEIVEEC